jgi:hypothetical protein
LIFVSLISFPNGSGRLVGGLHSDSSLLEVFTASSKQLFLQHNFKNPEDTIALNARSLVAVRKQLELFKSDCNKLADEVTLLRASNSALSGQLSSAQDNAQLVVSLQEQLDSAKKLISTNQITVSIASFNCQRAEENARSLQLNLDGEKLFPRNSCANDASHYLRNGMLFLEH